MNESSEQTHLEELKEIYCEAHKDIYGVKARWVYKQDLTEDQLLGMLDRLRAENRKMQAQQDLHNKEELAREAALCEQHGVDTETLVRWGVLAACTAWRSGMKWMDLEQEMYRKQFAEIDSSTSPE